MFQQCSFFCSISFHLFQSRELEEKKEGGQCSRRGGNDPLGHGYGILDAILALGDREKELAFVFVASNNLFMYYFVQSLVLQILPSLEFS